MVAASVFNKRRDWAKEKAGLKDGDLYVDYRKMLERKDIDAILIATHDPTHAQICIDSMEAGKHIYCEKPLTRYFDEVFKVYDAVKKTKKVFQIGSQGCSAAGWHKCAELIKAGGISQLVWGQGFYCRNSIKGEWNYMSRPNPRLKTSIGRNGSARSRSACPSAPISTIVGASISPIAPACWATWCRTGCTR